MKKVVVFLNVVVALFLVSNLDAQKVKLGNLKVDMKYLGLPSIGLDSSINSYSVKFIMNEDLITKQTYDMEWFKSKATIPGYPLLEYVGDVILEVTIGNVTMGKIEKKTEKVKPKKGTPYNLYYIEIPYNYFYGYKIIDRKSNKVIYENNFKTTPDFYQIPDSKYRDMVWTSDKFKSVKEINKWLKRNRSNLYRDIRKNVITKNVNNLSGDLKNKFGFTRQETRVKLKRLKYKKHPQYNDYLKINQIVERAFNESDYYSVENFKESIMPAIDFWTENEAKYDGNHKYEKKLKYACQLNLARVYYWMDDFENAKQWAKKVSEGDYKAKYGKRFLKTIGLTLKELEKVHRKTRHFSIKADEADYAFDEKVKKEIEEKIKSGDAIYFPEFNKFMGVGANTKVKHAELFMEGGESLKGYVVYDPFKYDTMPNFVVPSTIKIAYVQDGELKKMKMNYEKLDSFRFGNDLFEIKDVKIKIWKFTDKQKKLLVHVLWDNKKTQLIDAYTTMPIGKFSSFKDKRNKWLIYYKKNGNYYSVTDDSLLSSRGKIISNIIKEDCPEFAKKVREMKNKIKTIEDVEKILKDYDKCKE